MSHGSEQEPVRRPEQSGAADQSVPAPGRQGAAAPPHPGASGAGETSFGDADVPGATTAPAAAVEEAPPEDPVAVAKRQAEEYLALAQRTQADFENYRKRMAREAAQAADRGVHKAVKELLPALDHLDLALRSAEKEGLAPELVQGIRLIQEEFASALGRVGVEAFSPAGEAFDPEQHEAMASHPADGAEPGTVIEVYQQGYRLGGNVLRPARVVVAA
jgi:molecular chaperone GrpE